MQAINMSTLFKVRGLPGKVFLLMMSVMLTAQMTLSASTTNTHYDVKAAITITGRVLDEKNQPIAGVNISIKNSKKGGVTDANGKFSIEANEGALLIFSYTGFLTQEIPATKSSITVILKEDVKVLEEVSVGYQRLRKSDVTGAISSVKASELNLSTPTLSQALVGKVSGVQVSQVSGAPYSGTKIRVRGIGSVNASSEPLYVIDGYAVGGNVSK